MREFDLIERIRQSFPATADVIQGIGDDAAVLNLPAGKELVVSTDTLNQGIHFFEHADAADLGHKALAVSLSDLASMGAEPKWALLNLSLHSIDEAWLNGFIARRPRLHMDRREGFRLHNLQQRFFY